MTSFEKNWIAFFGFCLVRILPQKQSGMLTRRRHYQSRDSAIRATQSSGILAPSRKTLLEKHFPEKHFPERTLSRMYIWPNGHSPNVHFPEWTLARMHIWPNVHFPECTFSRMDTCRNIHLAEWTFPENLFSRIKLHFLENHF